jgi:hypothetical protein
VFQRARTNGDRRYVTNVDRPIVARGDEQQPDVWNPGERLPCGDIAHGADIAHAARLERAIGAAHLVDELLQLEDRGGIEPVRLLPLSFLAQLF